MTSNEIRNYYEQNCGKNSYLRKFYESLSYELSGAWMNASTKMDGNLLSDQEAIDDLTRRCGLELDLPPKCYACGKAVTCFREDHCIRCTCTKGGNGSAGGLVERAVISGLASLNVQIQRKPQLHLIPFMETISGDPKQAKQIGDVKATIGGEEFIVDVTFSSKPQCASVGEKEKIKTKEYTTNRKFPSVVARCVRPFALDAGGKWGEIMRKFFDEVVKMKKRTCPEGMKKEISWAFRYAIEGISLAVVRANGAYMHIMRKGYTKERFPKDDSDRDEEEVESTIAPMTSNNSTETVPATISNSSPTNNL